MPPQKPIPLADIAGLITLNGIVSLVASYYGGTLSDRFGRKSLLVISLLGNGLSYFSFIYADTYSSFALLMSLRGIFNPLYRVGLSAMISDLIAPEDRTDAYALQRLASNSGIATLLQAVIVTNSLQSLRLAPVLVVERW